MSNQSRIRVKSAHVPHHDLPPVLRALTSSSAHCPSSSHAGLPKSSRHPLPVLSPGRAHLLPPPGRASMIRFSCLELCPDCLSGQDCHLRQIPSRESRVCARRFQIQAGHGSVKEFDGLSGRIIRTRQHGVLRGISFPPFTE